MTGEPVITVVGNLASDPELRFTPSGAAVANVTIASTPRTYNKQTSEWEDGTTLWMRGSIWREAAENVAESLQKGARVIATGRLKQRDYDKDGEKRTAYEMDIDEIGPSMKYATARVTKAERQQGGGQVSPQQQAEFGGQVAAGQQAQQAAQQQAPWGQQQPQQAQWGQPPQSAPQQAVQQQQQAAQQPPQQQQQQGQQQTQGGWGQTPQYDEPPY